ncbi:MurR/RpiR family transcriptional regulator [Agrilactobacillus yilanensis]|uniref:MurR/RpiR family transcriptional regulator n=1 Tax=Agrilactobacillus yilanensis TaxID=2485997 RepID=A0ABW4J6V8_9LACO|nr:MurR/RpiR family transcriptional regulator [Agrilactobacillus yilanensis]
MPNFQLQLQIYHDKLSIRELDLADYLTKNQAEASRLSISKLSEKTGISIATISRFAKKLGYTNFQSMRVALTQDPENPVKLFEEIDLNDSTLAMAQKMFTSNIEALKMTAINLDSDELKTAVKLIIQCQRLGIYGLGASNIVALDGYHKFLKTAINVLYAADYHMQLMSITHLSSKDVAIIISQSGEDRDALTLANTAHKHHVPLIVITSVPTSRLARLADVYFVSVAEESRYRTEALHALIAQMSLMDTLFMVSAVNTDEKTALLFQEIQQQIKKTRH